MEDQFATEQLESNGQDDLNELRIVLLGVSGAGKSPTANAILGQEAFRESRTRESEIQRGRVEDRNISIIDTPGFFNTQLTDEEQRKQMMKSLDLSHPGPHVFLLLINLETFEEEERNIVDQILQNFGEEALLFTMVLFVGREKISKRDFNQIIESEETQKILNYFEGRFHVINSKTECDSYQITMLLKKSEEMVKNNGKQNYCKKIYLKNQEQQEQKERIEQKRENKCLSEKGDQDDPSTHLESQEEMEGLMEEIAKELQNPIVDLRIVLVGKTGSGKSSAGNTIIGNFEFEHKTSLRSVTRRCKRKKTMVENKIISVIDTPGLFDTLISEEQLKEELVRCIYMSVPGPHVFLLVIRLDVRFTDEEKNTVRWIQENFGEDAARYTIILFTHADILKKEPLEEYIKKCPDLESLIQSCSSQYHAFNNENIRGRSQVTELLKKIERMVNKNKGEHYTSEIYKKAQEKIEDRAFKKRVRDYGLTGLAVIGGGVVVAGAVAAAGGPSAVIAGAVGVVAKATKAKLGIKT